MQAQDSQLHSLAPPPLALARSRSLSLAQGCGGNCNVLKEIMDPVGGKIDLRDIVLGDDTMSVLEIWGAEYQENNCALIRAKDVPIIEKVAKRERSGYCVVGTITGDGRVVVHDAKDNTTPVDLPLDKVRRQPPYYLSSVRILLYICPHTTVYVCR